MTKRIFPLKNTTIAMSYIRVLLANGREFTITCRTDRVDVAVSIIPHDLLPKEYPEPSWIKDGAEKAI